MTDFTDHGDVLIGLTESQSADSDNRDRAREAHLFIEKRDGQWEPYWWTANDKKPRYTFDMTSPVVDQVAGEMEQADFDIVISPAGGEATKDDAKLLDGMIRNIESISSASDIFNLAARGMVTAGLDGWQIKQQYVDDDSFDQDLVIAPIANFIDSVWFWPFKLPDASDSEACVVLEAIERKTYEKRWPDGKGESVSDDRLSEAYYNKHDQVIVGQLYYIKKVPRELLMLSTGEVIESTPETQSILDELAQAGVTITDTRTRDKNVVMSRLFDGGGWLGKEQKTVFNQLPVIPDIGNFKIFENKLLYRGVVEKLIDPQRVFNYSKSREIEEGALAPRSKYWMTTDQAAGHEDELGTMNTNADPVQFYNADPKVPGPPQQQGGAAINPGLNTLSNDMNGIMRQTAGLFAANMGDNPGLQSGVALKRLQDKGDTGTIKYFRAHERAIRRTARILVDAIPVVYDTRRQVRILKEDGSFDMKMLNEKTMIQDQQTGKLIVLNDVTKGKYDVACSAGPAFQNRQEETVSAMTEMAQVMPEILQTGGDIMFNNLTSPGMDLLAARLRLQLFQAGLIPEDQQTDEEKQQTAAAAQQPQQPDAATLLAQAEISKAEAQNNKVMIQAQAIQRQEDRKDFEASQKAQAQQFKQVMDTMTQVLAGLDTNTKAFKTLRESGAAPPLMTGQAVLVHESQQDQ